MQRARDRAIVLRATRYRETDLIVELFGRDVGRFSALARGARRSKRRFGGAFQLGARIEVEARRARTGALATLDECTIYRIPDRVTANLDAFHQLAFVLEIVRLTTYESANPVQFDLTDAFLDALEEAPPSPEALALFELGVLKALGLELAIGAARHRPLDGLSLRGGGAVARSEVPNAYPIRPEALRTLARLWAGDITARFDEADTRSVRRAMDRLWHELTGQQLRSSRFLLDP